MPSMASMKDQYLARIQETQAVGNEVYGEKPALIWARDHHVNTRKESMNFDNASYLYQLYYQIGDIPNMVVE